MDLLELGPAVALAVHLFGPVDESLVKRRARALEDPLVRGVADEDVVEAVLALTVDVLRPHQLLLRHRAEVLGHRSLHGFRR